MTHRHANAGRDHASRPRNALPDDPDESSDLERDRHESFDETPPPPDDSDLDYDDIPCTDDADDSRWEALIADEDELDPEPEPGDFWVEPGQGSGVEGQGPE